MLGAIGKIFSQAAEAPYIADLIQWIQRVQRGAVERWLPVAIQNIACSSDRCTKTAITICITCRKPTCLEHSLVASTAEVVCVQCVKEIYKKFNVNPAPKPNGHASINDEDERVRLERVKRELRAKHFKTLGLRQNSTLEECKDKYKKLVIKHHPDRGGSVRKAQEINDAYSWLMKHHYNS